MKLTERKPNKRAGIIIRDLTGSKKMFKRLKGFLVDYFLVCYNGHWEVSHLMSDGNMKAYSGGLTNGYESVSLVLANGKRKMFYVHKLVASVYCPHPWWRMIVHHLDLNKLNNDPSNLLYMRRGEHIRYHWLLIHGENEKAQALIEKVKAENAKYPIDLTEVVYA